MANPEHLELLMQGVETWNAWREEKLVCPDLTDAPLSNIDLVSVNLHLADLRGTNLSGARLSMGNLIHTKFDNANLSGAIIGNAEMRHARFSGAKLSHALLGNSDMRHANFNGASLTGVNCWGADISHADFSYANLSNAKLGNVILISTILREADFTNVRLGHNVFTNIDLSSVKGLITIFHSAPSFIDFDTIVRSEGRIPKIFLRGCGLPDTLIEYIPSLLNNPIQFYPSFISYSSKDQMFADRLYADLQNKGVRCWLATEDLKIGDKIRTGIDKAIRLHEKLLLVLSKHSVASDWVEQEVETALERERREKRLILFPIRLDNAVMKIEGGWPALIRNTRHIGDFRRWKNHDSYQKAFVRLLRDLKADDKKNA